LVFCFLFFFFFFFKKKIHVDGTLSRRGRRHVAGSCDASVAKDDKCVQGMGVVQRHGHENWQEGDGFVFLFCVSRFLFGQETLVLPPEFKWPKLFDESNKKKLKK
jgi:hypothetical protein